MSLYSWLISYTFDCDKQIAEAYKHGEVLLWVCYQNWVIVAMALMIFFVALIGILIEIFRHKKELTTNK